MARKLGESGWPKCFSKPVKSGLASRFRKTSAAAALVARLFFASRDCTQKMGAQIAVSAQQKTITAAVSVIDLPNGQQQRCEPAAEGGRIASDVNGWLASAECCGYALPLFASFSFMRSEWHL